MSQRSTHASRDLLWDSLSLLLGSPFSFPPYLSLTPPFFIPWLLFIVPPPLLSPHLTIYTHKLLYMYITPLLSPLLYSFRRKWKAPKCNPQSPRFTLDSHLQSYPDFPLGFFSSVCDFEFSVIQPKKMATKSFHKSKVERLSFVYFFSLFFI